MSTTPRHRHPSRARATLRQILTALANPTTATATGRRTAHTR